MLLICGVIPDEGFPLTIGPAAFDGESLLLDGKVLPCTQGTAALVGAACEVTAYLGAEVPRATPRRRQGHRQGKPGSL